MLLWDELQGELGGYERARGWRDTGVESFHLLKRKFVVPAYLGLCAA